MPNIEIELNPVDFITVGTVGPKGKRVFHLQAGKDLQIVSLIIEKEQAWALSEAIQELVEDLDERYGGQTELNLTNVSMELREPIEPVFRVAQMGLGYDEDRNMVVLVAQELIVTEEDTNPDLVDPGVVRMWCSREQMRALSLHAMETVKSGRADPKQNGRLIYYWT
jgi:uncharacterized repeat protein (TIGR03847 family)